MPLGLQIEMGKGLCWLDAEHAWTEGDHDVTPCFSTQNPSSLSQTRAMHQVGFNDCPRFAAKSQGLQKVQGTLVSILRKMNTYRRVHRRTSLEFSVIARLRRFLTIDGILPQFERVVKR